MRLMIVDDHSGVREMIRDLVCHPTDEVCECVTADEAVQRAPEFRPDYVTMDLWMPGLNSFKGIQGIRASSPGTKVVVVTAYDQRDLREAATEAGAVDYVLKDNLSALRNVFRPASENPSMLTVASAAGDCNSDTPPGSASDRLAARIEELEAFPAFAANELRMPIRTIENFIAILQRQSPTLNDDARACVNRINEVCRQMHQKMDSLLAFTETGRRPLQQETVDLNALVQHCWNAARDGGAAQEFEFRQFKLPAVEADPELLGVVFRNVFENAIKFCAGRPSPTVEVNCCNVGDHAVIAVTDNGSGFDMRHANRLFLPLGRLHSADQYPGAGFGLAMARRIVQQHGGRIWAEGRLNQGATFYFTLPHHAAEPGSELKPS
jgi:signal transduction histidine kinase